MEDFSSPWFALLIGVVVGVTAMFLYQKRKSPSSDTHGLTVDVTDRARRGELDGFSGREDEIERVIHILLRRSKNNPLLIGEPGVGKTAIVEGLAARIIAKNVPDGLAGKRILSLDLASLLSETKYRGELETRVKAMIMALERDKQTILFIDETHLLGQMGSAEGSLNVADLIKPALARGELNIIGATTWKEYETYLRPNAPLDRRFQPVLVDEPSEAEALQILRHIKPQYEHFHDVKIPDTVLKAAVTLSKNKIVSRYLPDKAIDIIDEAAAKVSIDAHHGHAIPLGVVHAAATDKTGTVRVKDVEDVIAQWTQQAPAATKTRRVVKSTHARRKQK